MTLDIYLAFLVAATVLIVIPGPTNMVIVSSAIKAGFKPSLWIIFSSSGFIKMQNRIAGSLLIGAGILLAVTHKR